MGTKTRKLSNSVDSIIQWQTVKTADFTAVAGEGYFVNTTSNAITVTLPSSPSAGDTIILKDYARTWNTNNVTTDSVLSDGSTSDLRFDTEGQTVTFVYMDGTKGWSLINEDTTTELLTPPAFTSATGGTESTSGDYKIHSFTSSGCFVVSEVGNSSVNPLGGPAVVDYLVLAGGGGGRDDGGAPQGGAGGGGGGYRESKSPVAGTYSSSPLATPTGITVTAQTYSITVGAGGARQSNDGSNSVFSTITSTGGGGGGVYTNTPGRPGGSGGGGGANGGAGGSGNTPPVSPPQGNPGSPAPGGATPGAGGGAGTSGSGQNGGDGTSSAITGSAVARGGGGASGTPGGSGGSGGGGDRTVAGTNNLGGGGGGGNSACTSQAGGSGIVILRYKYQ